MILGLVGCRRWRYPESTITLSKGPDKGTHPFPSPTWSQLADRTLKQGPYRWWNDPAHLKICPSYEKELRQKLRAQLYAS